MPLAPLPNSEVGTQTTLTSSSNGAMSSLLLHFRIHPNIQGAEVDAGFLVRKSSGLLTLLQLLQSHQTPQCCHKVHGRSRQIGQLQKMGFSRSVVLDRTGSWKWTGRGSITMFALLQNLFPFCSIVRPQQRRDPGAKAAG